MSTQLYIKWTLYLEKLKALHWNDRNELPKYKYTSIERPNNYISHDRLNFKSAGPRISSDRRDEFFDVTSMPHCGRRLRAIQRRCYIV